jgi:hypothetical protein
MARIFHGVLTVDEFVATGTPGEYAITAATFESVTDPTGAGAFSVTTGMVLYVQAMDVETAEPLPGVAHRFKLTTVSASASDILDCTILWDEGGDEADAPLHRSIALLSEVTPNRKFALPPPSEIFSHIAAGLWEAAVLTDIRTIADAGGGDGDTYTNSSPTPTTIGGISAGSTFSDQSMAEMWDALLYPYQAPAFTSFGISGQATTLEVGATSGANPTFTWGTSNGGNVGSNSIGIADTTAAESLVSGHSNSGSATVTHAGVTKTSAGNETYTITGTNTHSATFTRTFTISWQWRVHFGESATSPLAAADILALRAGGLQGGFAGTYAFVAAASEYKYLAYPASMGTATSFKDQSTNLDVPFEAPYTVTVTNAFGVATSYNIHRSTNMIGSAISIVVS